MTVAVTQKGVWQSKKALWQTLNTGKSSTFQKALQKQVNSKKFTQWQRRARRVWRPVTSKSMNPRTKGIHTKAVHRTPTGKIVIETASGQEARKLRAKKVFKKDELEARTLLLGGLSVCAYDSPSDIPA